MENRPFFITLQIAKQPWLLVKEREGKARAISFESIEQAMQVFDRYWRLIRRYAPEDPRGVDRLLETVTNTPAVIRFVEGGEAMAKLAVDLAPVRQELKTLGSIHLLKMKPEITEYKVADVLELIMQELDRSPDKQPWKAKLQRYAGFYSVVKFGTKKRKAI